MSLVANAVMAEQAEASKPRHDGKPADMTKPAQVKTIR